eukprot:1143408-Pelagomonas_calceolata.AAC.4
MVSHRLLGAQAIGTTTCASLDSSQLLSTESWALSKSFIPLTTIKRMDPPTPLSLNRDFNGPAATVFVNQRRQGLRDAKVALEAACQRQKGYVDQKRQKVSINA